MEMSNLKSKVIPTTKLFCDTMRRSHLQDNGGLKAYKPLSEKQYQSSGMGK